MSEGKPKTTKRRVQVYLEPEEKDALECLASKFNKKASSVASDVLSRLISRPDLLIKLYSEAIMEALGQIGNTVAESGQASNGVAEKTLTLSTSPLVHSSSPPPQEPAREDEEEDEIPEAVKKPSDEQVELAVEWRYLTRTRDGFKPDKPARYKSTLRKERRKDAQLVWDELKERAKYLSEIEVSDQKREHERRMAMAEYEADQGLLAQYLELSEEDRAWVDSESRITAHNLELERNGNSLVVESNKPARIMAMRALLDRDLAKASLRIARATNTKGPQCINSR